MKQPPCKAHSQAFCICILASSKVKARSSGSASKKENILEGKGGKEGKIFGGEGGKGLGGTDQINGRNGRGRS